VRGLCPSFYTSAASSKTTVLCCCSKGGQVTASLPNVFALHNEASVRRRVSRQQAGDVTPR